MRGHDEPCRHPGAGRGPVVQSCAINSLVALMALDSGLRRNDVSFIGVNPLVETLE